MCLSQGNWLFRDTPRNIDWGNSRSRKILHTYVDYPGWPTDSEKFLQGYLRYVNYMICTCKDRVKNFRILNEWQGIGIEAGKVTEPPTLDSRAFVPRRGDLFQRAILRFRKQHHPKDQGKHANPGEHQKCRARYSLTLKCSKDHWEKL